MKLKKLFSLHMNKAIEMPEVSICKEHNIILTFIDKKIIVWDINKEEKKEFKTNWNINGGRNITCHLIHDNFLYIFYKRGKFELINLITGENFVSSHPNIRYKHILKTKELVVILNKKFRVISYENVLKFKELFENHEDIEELTYVKDITWGDIKHRTTCNLIQDKNILEELKDIENNYFYKDLNSDNYIMNHYETLCILKTN